MSSPRHLHDQGPTSAPDESVGAFWDERFASHDWPSEPDDALVELAGGLAPGTALDLGCGPGRNAIWLARRGWRVTGVDASAVGLALASARAREAGVEITWVQADLLAYDVVPAAAELVVLANVHLPPPEHRRLVELAKRALAPGGHLFVIGHHLDSLGRAGPPDPERLYTEERLRDELSGLVVEVLEQRTRAGGEGEAPLVDLVAWALRPR
ncbi:MAG TPA: class I SAM-dependent methyltransferase [Acidimicrobiales bacterium]|nr:class I SAM-dependent methyltransferase [Acidimicrobiales bacterium]